MNISPAAVLRALAEVPDRPHATNFYAGEGCCPPPDLLSPQGPAQRLGNLATHLTERWDAPIAVVGEAPGWRGAQQTGVAFTAPWDQYGTGMREPTATVMRRQLTQDQVEHLVVLCNAFPLHPHLPGQPHSNRTPTREDVAAAISPLSLMINTRLVIAVGLTAAKAVQVAGIDHPEVVGTQSVSARCLTVRHPSYGGAGEFAEQFTAAIAHFGLTA